MKPDRFVAIDLETTGLDPRASEIIEFGAVRVEEEKITERFERLARPSAPLPAAITRLTGITDADLAGAPGAGLALAEFLEFVGGDTLVAHNAAFEAGFLRAAGGGRFKREILDSLELARIALPEAPGHSLGKLAALLDLEHGGLHRALPDAELGARLWLALLEKLRELPLAVLSEIGWMLGPAAHPLKKVLLAAEQSAVAGGLTSGQPEYAALFETSKPQRREDFEPGEPPELDPDALARELGTGGPVARELGGYEERPQQLEMCRRVAGALNAGRHLIVEAGTGIGKSLAYLLPAAAWSGPGARKVLVSTNTKNLQSQLFNKDLPVLERALGRPLKSALLKGRKNYLCLRKLLYALREAAGELDEAERGAILPALVWAPRTRTGDVAECASLFLPGARDLLDKLTSDGPDCLGRACPQRKRCFLFRARTRAQAAEVIVANHSLVFSELGESAVLPPCDEIVFDEAHNLENAATRHLSVRVWPGRFYRVLNRLYKFRRRGRGRKRKDDASGTGLVPSLCGQVARARGKAPAGFLDRLEKDAAEANSRVVESVDALATFSAALAGLWGASRWRDKLRYSAADRRADLWAAVFSAKEGLVSQLAAVQHRAERLSESLVEDPDADELPRAEELGRDLAAAVERLRELIADIDFTVKADDGRYVYWAELAGRNQDQPELWAAPLEVAPMLAGQVFGQKRSCILSSATMTLAGRFDYLAGRLGLDRLEEGRVERLLLGTPFDFETQARVLVPGWLPEPGNAEAGRNSAELAAMLGELCRATRGRALVLFTSYGALDEVYRELGPLLEPEGISVLGQGRDGSREALLAALHEEENVVLLGTSSFWEGVDVRGAALSCLVLARLPFQVYTEPLFKARAELVESRGGSSFMDYSVPEAVLRFRQGFGRLIRSKTDRGIAVLADRRLISKRYGRAFLQSLPCGYRMASNSEQLARAAEEFFGTTSA